MKAMSGRTAGDTGKSGKIRERAALLVALSLCLSAQAQSPARDEAALVRAYSRALHDAVHAHWQPPDGADVTGVCALVVRQLPGGDVLDVQPHPTCEYDEAGQASVVDAVFQASPLPYRGYETVFSRELRLMFQTE